MIDKEKAMMIVYFVDGWFIVNLEGEVLAGPIQNHTDAIEYCKTRAWRVAQGWAP